MFGTTLYSAYFYSIHVSLRTHGRDVRAEGLKHAEEEGEEGGSVLKKQK